MNQTIAKKNLISDISKNNIPSPAYDTTRYSGGTKFKQHVNKCFTVSPRNTSARPSSPFTRSDMWSKNLANKNIKGTRDKICKISAESSILSVCGKSHDESNHCTCENESQRDEELCTCCLKYSEEGSQASCRSSDNCAKEIYKLTDTSDTQLVDSYEKLINSLKNSEYTSIYNLDLFEPHPRETRQINGKNKPPTGYDVSLVLPQCVCLTNYENRNEVENDDSVDTAHVTKSETMSDLICVPSIAEFSWDILQSGMVEKIPEKYTTHLFLEEKDESVCAQCMEFQEDVCKSKNCHTNRCLHEAFLQKLNKSFFLM